MNSCNEHHDGWTCTRQLHHDGDHFATDRMEYGSDVLGHVYTSWPAATASSDAPCAAVRLPRLEPWQPAAADMKPSWQTSYEKEHARANKLADEAGSLRTERDELLRENAQLRRQLERATRTGGQRGE